MVGEAEDGEAAIALARSLKPDVVLMDVRMPVMDGIEAPAGWRRRRARPVKVLVLTTFDLDEYVYEALRAGASGFLLKDVAAATSWCAASGWWPAGDALLAPSVTRRLIEDFARPRRPARRDRRPPRGSSPHRAGAEVLELLARGLSNAEIAGELYVSEATVKTHVAHVLMKLHLRDRVQAVVSPTSPGLGATGRELTGKDGPMREQAISDEMIRLGQFLKLAGLIDSGADAKPVAADGWSR